MDDPIFFKDYSSSVVFRHDRYGKATLFENEYLMAGLNCLEPGQMMEKHAHEIQTRLYLVLEGEAHLRVDDQEQVVGLGTVAWVPPGHTHRIANEGSQRLVMLVGIAPPHSD